MAEIQNDRVRLVADRPLQFADSLGRQSTLDGDATDQAQLGDGDADGHIARN